MQVLEEELWILISYLIIQQKVVNARCTFICTATLNIKENHIIKQNKIMLSPYCFLNYHVLKSSTFVPPSMGDLPYEMIGIFPNQLMLI